MVHFKNQDYKEILYPVHTLKMGVDIFDSFPKLLDYEEFGVRLPASLPLDKVFKYIVYTYDQKSPFVLQIDDLIQRKKEAIQEAGFVARNNIFPEAVKKILNCENEKINNIPKLILILSINVGVKGTFFRERLYFSAKNILLRLFFRILDIFDIF